MQERENQIWSILTLPRLEILISLDSILIHVQFH